MSKTVTIDDDQAKDWAEFQERKKKLSLMAELCRAITAQDTEKEAQLWPQIPLSPKILKCVKKIDGADYIRKLGMNTSRVDAEYGADWLDRDE